MCDPRTRRLRWRLGLLASVVVLSLAGLIRQCWLATRCRPPTSDVFYAGYDGIVITDGKLDGQRVVRLPDGNSGFVVCPCVAFVGEELVYAATGGLWRIAESGQRTWVSVPGLLANSTTALGGSDLRWIRPWSQKAIAQFNGVPASTGTMRRKVELIDLRTGEKTELAGVQDAIGGVGADDLAVIAHNGTLELRTGDRTRALPVQDAVPRELLAVDHHTQCLLMIVEARPGRQRVMKLDLVTMQTELLDRAFPAAAAIGVPDRREVWCSRSRRLSHGLVLAVYDWSGFDTRIRIAAPFPNWARAPAGYLTEPVARLIDHAANSATH